MDAVFWLSVTLACLLGAMSPGPSLAVIGSLTCKSGASCRDDFRSSSWAGHRAFALLTALGLVVLLSRYAAAFNLLQLAGCLYSSLDGAKLLFRCQLPDQQSPTHLIASGR